MCDHLGWRKTWDLPWVMGSITAYNIIEAEYLDEAEKIAKDCPCIVSIRVSELRSMPKENAATGGDRQPMSQCAHVRVRGNEKEKRA